MTRAQELAVSYPIQSSEVQAIFDLGFSDDEVVRILDAACPLVGTTITPLVLAYDLNDVTG